LGYADEGDIRRHLGRYAEGWPPAGGKPPTVADGLAFADTASGLLDGILSDKGVVAPATVPASFVLWLRDLAAMYAAAHVIKDLFPQAAGPASTTDQDRLMSWWRQGLADLRAGDVIPGDVLIIAGGTDLARSYWTTNPIDEHGNEHEPVFTRDQKW
jgi:hypothetical protein